MSPWVKLGTLESNLSPSCLSWSSAGPAALVKSRSTDFNLQQLQEEKVDCGTECHSAPVGAGGGSAFRESFRLVQTLFCVSALSSDGFGGDFTPCGSRGSTWGCGISPALCSPGLVVVSPHFTPHAHQPLLLICEFWECLKSVYCFYCLSGKTAMELWLFYGRRKAMWNPRLFFFFNPNKECGKVTSNLIPSEKSLAGYSLGACFAWFQKSTNK